jgi:predicted DNA-binding transcriptional regulator AlpA
MFMSHKEELMRKIQAHRRFLDELLLDIANFQEPAIPANTEKQRGVSQDRLMRAKEVQAYLGIKPATFYDWLKKGAIPPGENFGGCTRSKRWRFSQIDKSLAGHRNTDT